MNEIFIKNFGLILNGKIGVICNSCTVFTDFQVLEFENKEQLIEYATANNIILENNDLL